ncbi:hypothetical protein HAX54_038363, partial [Datura stramonium]|nr:hypothetical protein [Datura stramonium]
MQEYVKIVGQEEYIRAPHPENVKQKAWRYLSYHARLGSFARRWCIYVCAVVHDESCTMPAECDGHWRHAHAGRVRWTLEARPCRPSAMDVGGTPMPAECEGRWRHAHAGRVRGTLEA